MTELLQREMYFEELNENAQRDVFYDVKKSIRAELKAESGGEDDWNDKLRMRYLLASDFEEKQFIDNLVSARISQLFKGKIEY